MAYADFTYYATTYLGTAIAETDFPALAVKASAVIDQITFGRAELETVAANINKIKMAMCAVAEELHRQGTQGNADGIASESQGRYSVSYVASSSRSRSNQSKLSDAAALWLANTYLMFAGFNSGEYGTHADDS